MLQLGPFMVINLEMLGELKPFKNELGDRFFTGDSEGAKVLGFWLSLYIPDVTKAKDLECLISEDIKNLKVIKPVVENFYCALEIIEETIFIYDDDFEGLPDQMVMMTVPQFRQLLLEYISAVEVGIKRAESFIFEYISDGEAAKNEYYSVKGEGPC